MNSDDVFISVVIPVYNVQAFLSDCIESVLIQTSQESFEIILVDDGSTDRSGEICDGYQAKYPEKITVIHKENGGLVSARRAGLKQSCGKYIVWLDSDDTISDGYFDEIKKIYDADNSDVIIFNFNKINEKGRALHKKYKYVFNEGPVTKDEIYKKAVSGTSVNQLCKKVCKRDLYDVDADYSSYYGIQNGEDLLQSVPLFEKAKNFYYSKKGFYNYRINPNSLSRKVRANQYKSLGIIRPKLYESMVKSGYGSCENTELFFNYYLASIWITITDYVAASGKKDNTSVFQELYDLKYVQLAYKHFSGKEKGMKLFYAQEWNKLQRYAERICLINGLKNRFKVLIADLIWKTN